MAQTGLNKYRFVCIGGSAGSLEIVMHIVSEIPSNTQAAFLIVVHRKKSNDSIFAELIASRTGLTVKEIEDKEIITPGTIFLAPPDYHVLLEDEFNFSLDTSAKIHHSRPSIDLSFESAAETFKDATIGILLSGANADGANGLMQISRYKGYTIVQDPLSAEVDFMPQQALLLCKPDVVLEGRKIGKHLSELLIT